MGLLSIFGFFRNSRFGRRYRLDGPSGSDIAHRCGFERMEARQLLAADIHFGGVYFEEATGDDSAGDRFEITFAGGESGTQMTRVVIDTDKDGLGLSAGDLFFDTQAGGLGAFNSVGLVIQPTVGFTVTGVTVSDGGTLLSFDLVGFDAGEKLVFSIDVDEAQFVDPQNGEIDVNSLVEGGEFQRSKLTATFVAPHFFSAQGTAVFFDAFDDNFAALEAAGGTQLNLPPDNYIPPDSIDRTDRTAGAAALLNQQPLPITIAGTVYHDVNLDNTRDAGELGLANVTLELFRFDGSQYVSTGQSVTTNAAGDYLFEGLTPGTYAIAETQPARFFSVGATAGNVGGATRGVVENVDFIREIVLVGGEDSVDNDFAEAQEAELHGNVYIDANNNGLFDAGETGIAGATVIVQYLPTGGPLPPAIEVLTDAQGRWWATGLRPGSYRVAEVTPPGFIDGHDSAGTAGGTAHNPGDLITGVFLAGGQVGLDYNFGELLPSSIQGRVHADANGDCVFDPGETPLEGIVIRLLDSSGNVIDTTTTDIDGNYRFEGLAPGTYGVFEVQPGAYFDGDEHVGSAGGVISANDTITGITLGPGVQAVNYDFCEHEPVSISGFVYVDLNNNGVFDTGESPLSGVQLALTDAGGNSTGPTTTTNSNGFYRFDGLAPGVYGVRETQPIGFIDGLDSAGSAGGSATNPGDLILGAVLDPGVHGVNYNFGELLPSSIQGRVHADANGDCVFDPGETPLEGIVIRLLDSTGNVIDTTTTDSDGNYRFDGLAPGTYGVFEVQPGEYFDGDEHVGSAGGVISANDTITSITLGPGIHAVNYDFCEHEPVSISGFVYVDLNNNGVFDSGETPLSGVQLALTDPAGNSTGPTTTTNNNGFYRFDGLAPGTYGVRETQPSGFIDGLDSAGSAGGSATNPGDLILGAMLDPGVHGVNYNFGELLPSSIQGRVHADANGDCVFDPGETPLEGIVIRLLDSSGNVIDTTTTDIDGNYRFDGLAPGTYGVFEVQPGEYFDGDEHVGSAGGVISAMRISTVTLRSL